MSLNRRDLYFAIKERHKTTPTSLTYFEDARQCLMSKIGGTEASDEEMSEIDAFIDYFSKKLKKIWLQCHRSEKRMLSKHYDFFETEIELSVFKESKRVEQLQVNADEEVPSTSSAPPKKVPKVSSFRKLSESAQYRGAAKVRKSAEYSGAVIKAAAQNFRRGGHHAAAYIVQQLQADPEKGKTLKKILQKPIEPPMRVEEALSLLYERGYSRARYCEYRFDVNKYAGRKVVPSYKSVQAAKPMCRPPGIESSESCVKVPLKYVLEHTLLRIFDDQEVLDKLNELSEKKPVTATFYYKFGLDGSKGHGHFNQICASLSGDGSLLASHMVPLQIVAENDEELAILYSNALCNSPIACRPLNYWFVSETTKTLQEEIDRLKADLESIGSIRWNDKITIRFQEFWSLCDGKVVNVFMDNNSAQRCPFCHATPLQMSSPESIFTIDPEAYNLMCLSILHFGLRSFEFVLNMGYNQEFKLPQCRAEKDKKSRKKMEQKIHDQFFEKMGLRIGEVRDGGAGTSNTGNVARRAFEEYEFFAQVCNVPVALVKGLHHIWIALACNLPLDAKKFGEMAKKVLNVYFAHCSWYRLPPSVHKILVHGEEILRALPKTITPGMLSEEGSEGTNKDIKKAQIQHARQNSRENRALDTFHYAMDRSDPKILSFVVAKKLKSRPKRAIPQEVLAICIAPDAEKLKASSLPDCGGDDDDDSESSNYSIEEDDEDEEDIPMEVN